MKITFFALHLGFGGVEKFIITIANMLCEKYDVEIIATYKMVDKPSFALDKRVKVKYLINDLKPNKELLKKAIQSKNIIRIFKEGWISIKVLRLKKKRNIEAIKACNSDIVISTRDFHNELIGKYAKKDIVKITSEHNHHCENQQYIDRIVKSCEGFDYMLLNSKELTSFYKRMIPLVDVRNIPFCIEKPTCERKSDKVNHTYICVGRLSPEKGSLELIEDFKKIKELQNDAVLHVIGDGMLMGAMKDKIKEYSLEKSVIMHGFKTKNYIDEYYCQSSVFLMSSHTEAFGYVLLEAMACGVPCIAYDSAQGANEIIKDGENGYLLTNRNSCDYVSKAIALSNNEILWNEMSVKARECIKEFSCENTQKQWIDLMEEIKKKHSI